MSEVSSLEAAEIIGVSSETIRRNIDRKILSARRQGVRGIVRIEIDDLREFASRYDYRFNEELARRFASQV